MTTLLWLIVIATLTQPTKARLMGAAVASVLTIGHDYHLSDTTGALYYGSAAVTDMVIVFLLSVLRPVSRMAITLQRIHIAAICCNFVGWLLWWFRASPEPYNAAFIFIYLWMLVTLIMRGPLEYVGSSAVCRLRTGLRCRSDSCNFLGNGHSCEVRA